MELSPTDLLPSDYQYLPLFVRKSHIESYSFCPRQFYKQYVLEQDANPTYAMTSGTRFHDFAEKFFDVAPDFIPTDWHSFIPIEFGHYEYEMASWFIHYEVARFIDKPDNLWIPAYREIKVSSDEHLLSGTIDRIDWVDPDENTVTVVEYKTSKGVDEDSLKRQLGFYTIMVEEDLGLTVENVRLINPRLKKYLDFGRPDTKLPLKWADKIRAAYYDESLCAPKCSYVKYAVCQVCKTPHEAGLFRDLEDWDGSYQYTPRN